MKEAWTASAQMWYDEGENLLRIQVTKDVKLDLEELKNHYLVAGRLTGETKPFVLVEISSYFVLSAEARKYSAEQAESRRATAVVTKNNAAVFFVNLYIRLGKPASPVRLFSSEEKAIKWLKSFAGNK